MINQKGSKITFYAPFKNHYFNIILGTIAVITFLYVCVRAYLLSITYDEAFTFLYHALRPYLDILTFAGPVKSNSHLLNTFLIKFFVGIFGISEFTIRIPALLGFLVYLIAICKILRLFLKEWYLILGICLLMLNPFMLDFFSCARGYSLGLGFFALSLYFLFEEIVYSEKK